MLCQKKKKKKIKNNDETPKKYMKIYNNILYFEPATLTRDVTCSKTKIDVKNIGDKKLSVE